MDEKKKKKKTRQPDGRGAKGKEPKLGEEPRGTGRLGECWGGNRAGRQRASGPLPALRSARVAWLQDAASRKWGPLGGQMSGRQVTFTVLPALSGMSKEVASHLIQQLPGVLCSTRHRPPTLETSKLRL